MTALLLIISGLLAALGFYYSFRLSQELTSKRNRADAVIKFLCASGGDLCHENRRELAKAFGLPSFDGTYRNDLTLAEFDAGCRDYQRQIYGKANRE